MVADLTPRQQRLEAAGAFLVKIGGSATPGELGSGLGLGNRTRQAEVVADLVAAEWATRAGRQVTLTPEGWSHFAGIGPGSAGEVLDRVLTGWPARHRAFLELLVCSIIARHHLAKAYPWHEHLGFMTIGETSTGKSAMADLVCHLFGFDRVQTSVHTPGETSGSLLGRRVQSAEGWAWEPAPMTRRPFIFLDEFDKADLQVQGRAWNYFRGTVATPAEGEVHQLLPTPMLAANPPAKGDRLSAMRPEYRRRSVVLDTGTMAGRGRELAKHLRAFYASSTPADRLSLSALVPPAALADGAMEVFEAGEETLEAAGLAEFPGDRPLELATLGRLALLGPQASHQLAAVATMADYLTVTESVPDQVIDGWQVAVADWASQVTGGEHLMTDLERSKRAKAEALEQATSNRRQTQHAEQGVLQAGAELAERCRLARDLDLHGNKVPREHKPAAAGLRKALTRHLDSASKVRTVAGLADITALATPVLEEAARLVATIKAERDQVEAAGRDVMRDQKRERDDRKQQADLDAERLRQSRAAWKAQLKATNAALRKLQGFSARTTTRPDESPWDVLRQIRLGGYALLSYQEPAPAVRPKGFWASATYQYPRGYWIVNATRQGWPGTKQGCPALASWGTNTQDVLAPAIAGLHELKASLLRELERTKPRKRPPASRRAITR